MWKFAPAVLLCLTSCQSTDATQQQPTVSGSSIHTSSFSTIATSSDEVRSTLEFGPIARVDMKTGFTIIISEGYDGSVEREIVYQAGTDRYFFSLGLDYETALSGAVVFGSEAAAGVLAEVVLSDLDTGSLLRNRWAQNSGVVDVALNDAQMILTLSGVVMAASDAAAADPTYGPFAGRITGRLDYGCNYLAARATCSTDDGACVTMVAQAGSAAAADANRVKTGDPEWASAFCRAHKPQ
jgi:hypothetical protein